MCAIVLRYVAVFNNLEKKSALRKWSENIGIDKDTGSVVWEHCNSESRFRSLVVCEDRKSNIHCVICTNTYRNLT